MDGLGAPEIALLLAVALLTLAPAIMGYIIGSNRAIGSLGGLLLGFFFSIIGVIVVYFLPRKDEPKFYNFNQSSSADELKKYKDLLDSGAISEEEYKDQKARILGK